MATPQVLYEGMAGDHDLGAAILLEPTHRTQPRLETAVVSLDVIVGVLIGAMPRRREQLAERGRVGRRLVGDDLHGRDLGCGDGPLEEAAGGLGVAPRGDEHVDDLAELVDRTVDIAPAAGHLDVGLVHEPTISYGVPARARSLGEQAREPLHPPVDGDVVNLDTALGE
jgi:hypothetical protein